MLDRNTGMFSLFPDFYEQLATLMNERRAYGMMKVKILESPRVFLFSADLIEVLLHSNELLDKTDIYKYLHSFIGFGILNRFVGVSEDGMHGGKHQRLKKLSKLPFGL